MEFPLALNASHNKSKNKFTEKATNFSLVTLRLRVSARSFLVGPSVTYDARSKQSSAAAMPATRLHNPSAPAAWSSATEP